MTITPKYLQKIGACLDSVTYAEQHLNGGKPLSKVVERLHRGDWLIWLLLKTETINHRQAVWLACVAARRALRFVGETDQRPEKAILAAEAWVKAPSKETGEAADTAAAYAADYASSAASSAATAAAYASYADYAANAGFAAFAAADAAASAAYATDTAACAAAYAAAKEKEHRAIADSMRAEMRKKSFRALGERKP